MKFHLTENKPNARLQQVKLQNTEKNERPK